MPESALMPVRFRLQELLAAHDPPWSQSELARRSGVSLVTINGIANNRTKQVSLETMDKLSRALGVAPGELIEHVKKGRR
jgi:DNA-binding Xre family transcriptional regulator